MIVGAGVSRVHFSDVDEIDPSVQRPVDLRVAFSLCVLRTLGH